MNDAKSTWPLQPYPWPDLLSFLSGAGHSSLPLVGYGSLVNAESAAVTLKSTESPTPIPVRAYGGKRIFNYAMARIPSRYVASKNELECAALNVEPAAPDHELNGILMQIQLSDLEAFRQREADYDLIPVQWTPFEEPGADRKPAYILSCRPGEPSGVRIRNDIYPNPDYLRICREGASSYGDTFRKVWEKTTYLPDRCTLVGEVF